MPKTIKVETDTLTLSLGPVDSGSLSTHSVIDTETIFRFTIMGRKHTLVVGFKVAPGPILVK